MRKRKAKKSRGDQSGLRNKNRKLCGSNARNQKPGVVCLLCAMWFCLRSLLPPRPAPRQWVWVCAVYTIYVVITEVGRIREQKAERTERDRDKNTP